MIPAVTCEDQPVHYFPPLDHKGEQDGFCCGDISDHPQSVLTAGELLSSYVVVQHCWPLISTQPSAAGEDKQTVVDDGNTKQQH